MRGADISGDHELVVTKIKIKLEERRSNLEPKKFEGQVQNQQADMPRYEETICKYNEKEAG